jgi:pyruvate/2-oxoglutarate dehydrogenase complex dihydrolipoamide dehydrogenase (E3) component
MTNKVSEFAPQLPEATAIRSETPFRVWVADGNSNRLFGAHMLAAEGGEIIQTALAAGSTQGRSLCTVQHSYQRSALHWGLFLARDGRAWLHGCAH